MVLMRAGAKKIKNKFAFLIDMTRKKIRLIAITSKFLVNEVMS